MTEKYLSTLSEIDLLAKNLPLPNSSPYLGVGLSGVALYFFIRHQVKTANQFLHQALAMESQRFTKLGLMDGTTGILWAAQMMEKAGCLKLSKEAQMILKQKTFESNNLRTRFLASSKNELMAGALGEYIYIQGSKYPQTPPGLDELIAKTGPTRFGPFWPFEEPQSRDRWRRTQEIEFGIAHGSFGPFLRLAQQELQGSSVRRKLLERTIPTALKALDQFSLGDLPKTSGPEKPDGSWTCGWCYGEPGVGFALFIGGLAVENFEALDRGLELFLRGCSKERIQKVHRFGFSLCHGSSGLALMAHRLYQISGLSELQRMRDQMMDLAISQWQLLGDSRSELDASFLYGFLGLGAVLTTLNQENTFPWDQMILTGMESA